MRSRRKSSSTKKSTSVDGSPPSWWRRVWRCWRGKDRLPIMCRREPAERCSARPGQRPGPQGKGGSGEKPHEARGGEIGREKVGVFQSGGAGQCLGGEISAADSTF